MRKNLNRSGYGWAKTGGPVRVAMKYSLMDEEDKDINITDIVVGLFMIFLVFYVVSAGWKKGK